jgi:hypothetical protein
VPNQLPKFDVFSACLSTSVELSPVDDFFSLYPELSPLFLALVVPYPNEPPEFSVSSLFLSFYSLSDV